MSNPTSAISTWQKFLKKCLIQRLDPDKFEDFSKKLNNKVPISSIELANTILSTETYPTTNLTIDPRYLVYIQRVISSGLVSLTDILDALFEIGQSTQPPIKNEDGIPPISREPVEIAILTSLVTLVPTLQRGPTTKDGIHTLLAVITKWMNAVIAANDSDGMGGVLNDTGLEDLGLGVGVMNKYKKECVGELIVAIGRNEAMGSWMRGGMEIGKDKRLSFETTLPMLSHVFQQSNIELASRIDGLIRRNPAVGQDLLAGGLNNMNIAANPAQGLLDMGPGQLSRAGLYIFFHSLLVGIPLVDDEYILNYLNNRYQGDRATAATDLIVAVLDCLTNSLYRSESTRSLYRHFLVNKVPLLLVKLQIPNMTAHYIINNALLKSDTAALDTSLGNTSADNMMLDLPNDMKQEFLFSCALHQVIEENKIQQILSEIPLQTMPSKRYSAKELVEESLLDPDRVERLLEEIDEAEGNSGAAAMAIVEIIRTLCEQKDTMPLKNICSYLTRKPKSIDFILLYCKPPQFLECLCELLHSWKYDEDQGEYQPVYEEFGYVLLFVLTTIHRYDMGLGDIGNIPEKSFISRIIRFGSKEKSMEDLSKSSKTNELLGSWIKALYDDQGGGISDELLSSCKPQEFFLFVPTLFSQSVEAFNRGILDLTTLKSGLECNALLWITNHLWETHPESEVQNTLKVLNAFLFPDDQLPSDVAEIHSTIISICSRNLERVLREHLRADVTLYTSSDGEKIFQTVASHVNFNRSGYPSQSEMESWNNGGGFLPALRSMLQSLVMWAANPEINMTPAAYTHRLLLSTWRLLGAKPIIRTLIDELVNYHQQGIGTGDIALDIIVALICAPTLETFNTTIHEVATGVKLTTDERHDGRITLIDALRTISEDNKAAIEDAQRAELVMRLLRRVEMQTAVGAAAAANINVNANVHVVVGGAVGGFDGMLMDDAGGSAGLGVGVGMDASVMGIDDGMFGNMGGSADLVLGDDPMSGL